MNNNTDEFLNYFNKIYENNLIISNVETRFDTGWKVDNITVEPLYLNLISWITGIRLGTQSIDLFIENYMSLFDKDTEQYTGLLKPDNDIELLRFLETLLLQETVKKDHMYYVIVKDKSTIGLLYFYGYKEEYRKANLTICIKSENRGKGLSLKIIKSVIDNFMSQGSNSKLVRLGYEVETTNLKSINLMEKYLVFEGFKKEGLLRNNYGVCVDCHIYSLIIN